MKDVRFLSLLLLAAGITNGSNNTQKKLSYEIDPEYQNLVMNEDSLVPLPTFSKSPEYFVYGGIFSLSDQSGNPSSSGYQSALAMQCAVKDVNTIAAKQGPNTTFYYNIFNDLTNPMSAMGAAVQLLTGGVPVTIGPVSSDSATAVASLYASYNYTVISGSATADVLSDQSVYGVFYRTIPPDQQTAIVLGDLLIYLNWTLVTPIYTGDQYGLSGQTEFTNVAIDRDILLTCGRVIPPGQLTGIQNTIKCLSTSQSTVVLLWMEASDAANVINAFYESGQLADLTFVATDSWGDIQDLEAFTGGNFPVSYLEGTLAVVPKLGDTTSYDNCVKVLKGDSDVLPYFTDFWERSLRCIYTNDTSIESCPADVQERDSYPNITCRCIDSDNLALNTPTVRF
jgi:ABC-type branched-subunit amino acid transport system substrate-binding protein